MVQLQMMSEGLSEILKQKYSSEESERVEFEKKVKVSELEAAMIINSARKKQGKKKGEAVKLNPRNFADKKV